MAAVATSEALKRKAEEGGESSAQRRCQEAKQEIAIPVPMKTEDFNSDLLRIYYDRLFPFQKMHRWLSYKNDPMNKADFFLRREFTFVLQGDIFCRYLCFRDAEEFKAQVLSRQPIRMEIGAVFSHPPKSHNIITKDAYRPLERELVFDIDMDDYDNVRTCCSGAKICPKCWTFMKIAIKTLQRALREDFGFEHFFFVYSGRRGVHCWVCDREARVLSNEQRAAVAEYLNVVASGANRCRTEIRMNGCAEFHPSIAEALKICEHHFKDDPQGVLQGQEILSRDRPHLASILSTLQPAEQERMKKFLDAKPEARSLDIWRELEQVEAERMRSASQWRQRQEAKLMLKEILLQYSYPRLDINVSKQMNHLLKSPFVVHPKTGRVCVPIDPAKVDVFDPAQVPTIGRLVDELNQTGDVQQTSLKEYTQWFETRFLQPMEGALAQGVASMEW